MRIMLRDAARVSWIGMFVLVALIASMAMAQATSKTHELNGTVVEVDGNTLVVKMADGSVQMFTPPADRKFMIDGKEVMVGQLQPGTTLKAQVTDTSTPGTMKTVETLTGTVRYAAGPTVVLKLPSGEVHQYFIDKDHPAKFYDNNGKEITVFDLRKGMNIKATKITESPTVELSQTVAVTGMGPKTTTTTTTVTQTQPASKPAAAPATETTATHAEHGETPKKLPHTGSELPLIALVGLLLVGAGLVVRSYRLN